MGKWQKHKKTHDTQESQGVIPFPVGDDKAAGNITKINMKNK